MALNRLVDEPFDRKNPRTKDWPHVSGKVSREEIKKLILLSGAVFVFSTLMINVLAFLLSPVVIVLLWLYPYSKRFTNYPHLFLGLVYFLIPIAVDVALNEDISLEAVILGLAMGTWVAGFDILYALQDKDFDEAQGLGSAVVRLGVEGALKLSKILHIGTLIFLILLGVVSEKLSLFYFLGTLALATFLYYEHGLIKPWDLSKVNKAFFTVNGYVSVVFFLVVFLDATLL